MAYNPDEPRDEKGEWTDMAMAAVAVGNTNFLSVAAHDIKAIKKVPGYMDWSQEIQNRINSGKIILPKDVTIEMAASIYGYTSSTYDDMNKLLRGEGVGNKKQTETTQTLINITKTALEKLPEKYKYNGIVYRGAQLTDSQIQNYQEAFNSGKPIDHPFFTSTASKSGNLFGGNTKYIITSKTGKSISDFSRAGKQESEVLFNSGTKFQVSKISKHGSRYTITMKEI